LSQAASFLLLTMQGLDMVALGKSFSSLIEQGWIVPENLARHLFFIKRKALLRRLRVMALAKMPFADSLVELQKRAKDAKDGIMYAALTSMVTRQQRGLELAQTLNGWFSPIDIMLLEAGDRRGYESFAEAIDDVLALRGATKEMIGYVLSSLFEPLVMLGSIYALIVWLAGSFNDQVLSLMQIDPSRLHGSARTLYEIGLFSKTTWAWIVPFMFLLLIGALFWSLPGVTLGKHVFFVSHWRSFLDKYMPPWSIYSAITSSQWMLSFSKLARAGYSYEEILSRTAKLASPWLRTRIIAIERLYRKGLTLDRSMAKTGYDFPSPDVIQDISAFANRPGFEEALQVIANERVKSVTLLVKGMSQIITGLGFIATGLSMIWIMDAFNTFQNQITSIVQQMH